MKELTLVVPYYNNSHMLAFQCGVWWTYPGDYRLRFRDRLKERLHIIVVDDGSEKAPAERVLRKAKLGIDLRLYRVKDRIEWNDVGARNLGMRHVKTPWALLTDMDHVITPATMRAILNTEPSAGRYYTLDREWADGRPVKPHCNSYLVEKDVFWAAGGYDEDYAGLWGGDVEFLQVLRQHASHDHLGGYPLYLWQSAMLDGRTPRTPAQLKEWGRQRRAIQAKKRGGELPALPERPIRFEWERLL